MQLDRVGWNMDVTSIAFIVSHWPPVTPPVAWQSSYVSPWHLRLTRAVDTSFDKSCDKSCEWSFDKSCDKSCEWSCDTSCDKSCEWSCDTSCEESCDSCCAWTLCLWVQSFLCSSSPCFKHFERCSSVCCRQVSFKDVRSMCLWLCEF